MHHSPNRKSSLTNQMKNLLVSSLLAVVVTAAVISTVTAQPGGHLSPLQPVVTVNVATDLSSSDAGFFLGEARGYFREVGIEIKFVRFPSSTEMLPMVAIDQIQVAGGITSVALFNAVKRGVGLRFLADKGHNLPQKPYDTVVVRRELLSEIREIKDLKGRRFGTASIESANEYLIDAVLAAGGLGKGDVDIVVLDSFSNITLALMNGAIDAALHLEPFITIGMQQGVLEKLLDLTQILPRAQLGLLVASPTFCGRLELSGRFMVAYLRGLRDYVDTFIYGKKDEEIYRIMAEYTDLKDVNLWKQVTVPGLNPNGYFFKDDIKKQIQWYKRKGYYKGDVDVDEVTDYRPVDFALRYLGRHRYPISMD
jgi:NitT/TauT family transport system substrate-binding protein